MAAKQELRAAMIIHRSYKDFVLYLYLHMAYADGEFHPLERQMIYNKICRLYPYHNNPYHLIDLQEETYLMFDRRTVNQVITASFKHFSEFNFLLRYKVYLDLHDIVHADGKVLQSEITAINELRRIINLSIKPISDYYRPRF